MGALGVLVLALSLVQPQLELNNGQCVVTTCNGVAYHLRWAARQTVIIGALCMKDLSALLSFPTLQGAS